MESTILKNLIISNLIQCQKLLSGVNKHQVESNGETKLNMLPLANHLAELAAVIRDSGIQEATQRHQDFAVIPHARWLAKQAAAKRFKQSYHAAGRKGGRSKSNAKRTASKANGKRGGRPKISGEQLLQRLVLWAKDTAADPGYSSQIAEKVLRQVPKLALKLRFQLIQRLEAAGLDIGIVVGKIYGERLNSEQARRRLLQRRKGVRGKRRWRKKPSQEMLRSRTPKQPWPCFEEKNGALQLMLPDAATEQT